MTAKTCRNCPAKLRHFFIHNVLAIDDTEHRIALGFAIGMFVTWTPTIPFQMVLTLLLCAGMRANKVVGLPLVWITNPATMVPVYYMNFVLGCRVLHQECSTSAFLAEANNIAREAATFAEVLQASFQLVKDFFWPLCVGSFLVALLFSVPSYFFVRSAVVRFRASRHHRARSPKYPVQSGKAAN